MKPKVLVTAIGTMTATAIVTELKKVNEFYVIGTDINPASQIVTSGEVDEFYIFPSSVENEEDYIKYVLEFCKEKQIEYYFAVIDEEVANLSEHRKNFEKLGIKLCIPNDSLIEVCHNKDVFSKWIKEYIPSIGIETFENCEMLTDMDYPVFVKPIQGRASIGCEKISDKSQLMELFRNGNNSDFIIQKYIEGEIITVDLIRNKLTGQSMQIQRKELLRNSNGCGIAVEIIKDEELQDICVSLMERLDLNGVVNAEFFKTNLGYKIIEINPRFSAGTSFSCMAGCNTVLNALRIAQKQECIFKEVNVNQRFAKRYETYCMN